MVLRVLYKPRLELPWTHSKSFHRERKYSVVQIAQNGYKVLLKFANIQLATVDRSKSKQLHML